jgi:hypothetical protein
MTFSRPNFGSSRKIHPGQKIHSSLLQADRTRYIPKASPVEDGNAFWKMLLDKNAKRIYDDEWLESDMYQYTRSVVQNLIKEGNDTELQRLHQIAITGGSKPLFRLWHS